MPDAQVTTTHDFRLRKNSILEYLSPFGVITTKAFIYRLLSFLGITVLSIFTLAIAVPIILEYLKKENYVALVSAVTFALFIYFFLLAWFLVSTLTKDYRTNGTPIPFIFALATPFVPFLLLIKYMLSSKLEKEVNKTWAEQQQQARDKNKTKTHVKKRKAFDKD